MPLLRIPRIIPTFILPLLLLALWAFPALGQVSEDCFTSIPICANTFVQNNHGPGSGVGTRPSELPAGGCLAAENAGRWYTFQTSGAASAMTVLLTPNNATADYNWAIFNITGQHCDDIATNPLLLISCNASTTPGNTGANGGSLQTSQGAAGTPFNNTIAVGPNQTYVIYIENANADNGGYTLDFTFTGATGLADNAPAVLDSVRGNAYCGAETIFLDFNEQILCSSILPGAFTVTGPGGYASNVNLAFSADCSFDPASHSDVVFLELTTPISIDGAYTLNIAGGLEDLCGNVLPPTVFNFVVDRPEMFIDSIAPIYCGDNAIRIFFSDSIACATLDASDFLLISSNNDTIDIVDVQGINCQVQASLNEINFTLVLDTFLLDVAPVTYSLQLTPTYSDTCNQAGQGDTITLQIADSLVADAGPPAFVCFDANATVLNGLGSSGAPDLHYIWTPSVGLDFSNSPTPTATIGTTSTYYLQVYRGGCFSPLDSVTIQYITPPNMSWSGEQTICEGSSTTINFSGVTAVDWPGVGVSVGSVTISPTTTTTYNVTPYNLTCAGPVVPITISVTEGPTGNIQLSQPVVCGYDDTMLVSFVGTFNGFQDVPTWDFGSAVVISGSGFGPYELMWVNDEVGQIELSVSSFGCITEFTADYTAFAKPIVEAGPDLYRCEDGPGVTLQGAIVTNNSCVISWAPGGAPLSNDAILNPISFTNTTTDYILTAVCAGCPSEPDTMTMIVNPKPLALVASPVVTKCEGQSVNLNGSASSGTPPYSYEWYPDSTLNPTNVPNPEANPSVSQFYQFVVKDSMGCASDTTNVLVEVEPVPIVDAGRDTFICQGGTGIMLTATVLNPGFNGYTYQWSPTLGLTNPNAQTTYANPPVTTTYTCTVVSNGTGCTSETTALDTLAFVTVFVRPRPIANAGPDVTVCQFDSVQIGGTPSGGSNPLFTFLWQPSTGLSDSTAQLPMASPPATTTYYLTVGSDGCLSVADTMTVTVDPRPNLVILTPDTALCPYDSVQLQVSLSGVPGTPEIFWTPAVGLSDSTELEPIAQPQTTTDYVINLVTPQCLTPTRDTVTLTVIDLPVVDANTTDEQLLICYDDSLLMPASVTHTGPFTVSWTPTQWVTDSTIVATTAFPLSPTMFYLTAYSNGCYKTDSVEVFVADSITAIAVADTPIVCRGQQVQLRSLTPAPAFYFWAPTETLLDTVGPVVTAGPVVTTTYVLTVERDGCIDTAHVTVTVLPQPVANFEVPTPLSCEGGEVQFVDRSTEAVSYAWYFGDGGVSNLPNPLYTYDAAGVYDVTLIVTAVGTCADTLTRPLAMDVRTRAQASFRSVPEIPETIYLPNAQVEFQSSSRGSADLQHIWDFGDGQTSTERNPTHRYEVPGQYTVRLVVFDDAGCTSFAEQGLLTVLAPELSIFNVFTPDADGFNDTWRPQYVGSESFEVYVYDRWGNQVYAHNGTAAEWNGTLNGSEVPAGHYFYVVKVGDKIYKGGVTLLRP